MAYADAGGATWANLDQATRDLFNTTWPGEGETRWTWENAGKKGSYEDYKAGKQDLAGNPIPAAPAAPAPAAPAPAAPGEPAKTWDTIGQPTRDLFTRYYHGLAQQRWEWENAGSKGTWLAYAQGRQDISGNPMTWAAVNQDTRDLFTYFYKDLAQKRWEWENGGKKGSYADYVAGKQDVNGNPITPAAPGAPAAPAAPAAPGAPAPVPLTLADDYLSLARAMGEAARAAQVESRLRGYLVEPVFAAGGRWTYQAVLGADGKPLRLDESRLTDAQIGELAARAAAARIAAEGRYLDPQTGAWVATPAALHQAALADLARAQGAEIAYLQGARADLLKSQSQELAARAAATTAGITGYAPGGAPTLERTRIEADIAATRDRIRVAEQQGNAQLALQERERLDKLEQAHADLRLREAAQSGFMVGGAPTLERQRIDADIAATTRRLDIAQRQGNERLALEERQRLDQLQSAQAAQRLRERQEAFGEASKAAELTGYFNQPGPLGTGAAGQPPGREGVVTAWQQGQPQGQETLEARRLREETALRAGQLTGEYGGAPTLPAREFAEKTAQQQFERAANPARSFENELARGITGITGPAGVAAPWLGGSPTDPYGAYGRYAQVNLGQPGGADHYATTVGPGGATYHYLTQTGGDPISLASNLVRVPAVVNAVKGGALVPTAGQINAPSTLEMAGRAAITPRQYRLMNLRTYEGMNPAERLITESFARAGGLPSEEQQFMVRSGMPKEESVRPSFMGT